MFMNKLGPVLLLSSLLALIAPVHANAFDVSDDDEEMELDAVDACGLPPSGGVLATFRTAGGATFNSYITNPTGINDAIRLWRNPTLRKKIPVGRLSCAPVAWNCPWTWSQVPSSVVFAENTVELCDGIPSDVEKNCSHFGMGTYCPWSAVLIELRDCRFSASCPLVLR
jgi:hypothetical protein